MTSKRKIPSLRSRLRDDAKSELTILVMDASIALKKLSSPAGISVTDLAKMIGSSQTESLEKALITKLADRKEAELEQIYTAQKAEDSAK